MPSISVERYAAEHQPLWDRFVAGAKNATFLFLRGYMDYHRDRFEDWSYLVFEEGALRAVLPGNRTADDAVASHQGLTYGGLVVEPEATLRDVLQCLHALLERMRRDGFERLIYKRIPRFYCALPDDEIDYALFLLEARLVRRDCALVVAQQDRLPLRKGRKSEISKARRCGVQFVEEAGLAPFWERVLTPRLRARYGVSPVHSLDEINLLASRFPESIRQFSAYAGEQIVAGVTIFETATTAHAQYSAVTELGQELGALDGLYGWLLDERFRHKRYFDFGICNESEGRALNLGLLSWKEGFGARSCAHDFYEVPTAHNERLSNVSSVAGRSAAPGGSLAP